MQKTYPNISFKMKYRKLGNSHLNLSVLGFGGARLSDYDKSISAITTAVQHGVNFFETGPGYGDSEKIIGTGVKKYRKNVFLSTKLRLVDENGKYYTYDDIIEKVELSLKRLETDRIDLFNIWNLNNPNQLKDAIKMGDFFRAINKLKNDGVIGFLGFSSHDCYRNVKYYVDTGLFTSAILPYNIFDCRNINSIKYAYAHGLGIIAMKPLFGGVALLVPDIFNEPVYELNRLAVLNLKFVLSSQFVCSAISGMVDQTEVTNNLNVIKELNDSDTQFQKSVIHELKKKYYSLIKLCSGCRYCDHCPMNIPIPKLLKKYNLLLLFGEKIYKFSDFIELEKDIDIINNCVKCRQCEKSCPEKIDIINRLSKLYQSIRR